MSGATKDYRFGQKNHWRRWAWNRIAERVEAPRDAVVVGLFGRDALDVQEAERRGFRRQNMIGVDLDQGVVDSMRRAGITAINGRLSDVLIAWTGEPRISVVVADFCSGITPEVFEAIKAMALPFAMQPSSVFAINLLRGRETGRCREIVLSCNERAKSLVESGRATKEALKVHKHRGFIAYSMFSTFAGFEDRGAFGDIDTDSRLSTHTYASGMQRFDSAVWVQRPSFTPALMKEIIDPVVHKLVRGGAERRSVSRKISAAKAIRSMRLDGTL